MICNIARQEGRLQVGSCSGSGAVQGLQVSWGEKRCDVTESDANCQVSVVGSPTSTRTRTKERARIGRAQGAPRAQSEVARQEGKGTIRLGDARPAEGFAGITKISPHRRIATPQDAGPWFRRNLYSCGI